jgi:hypothetical protein
MCEHIEVNGGSATQMQIVVPKSLYNELAATLSQSDLNDAVVDSLKDTLRKLRFKRDLERVAQRREP